MGYHQAGFDVVGVDIVPQSNYPFEFIQDDVVEFLKWHGGRFGTMRARFDAVHASPPCQSFTAYRRRGAGVGDKYVNLIPETRELLQDLDLPYVIENVPGAPLLDPVQLCGSSFGLDIRRHRLFETNWPLEGKACSHDWQTPRFPPATNRMNLRRTVEVGAWRCAHLAPAAMDIHWMTNKEISEAIPPAYTKHIGLQLAAHVTNRQLVNA